MFIGVSMDKCLACRWFQFLAQAIFIIYNFLQTETFANSIFSHGCSSLNLLKGFDDKALWDEKKKIYYTIRSEVDGFTDVVWEKVDFR